MDIIDEDEAWDALSEAVEALRVYGVPDQEIMKEVRDICVSFPTQGTTAGTDED